MRGYFMNSIFFFIQAWSVASIASSVIWNFAQRKSKLMHVFYNLLVFSLPYDLNPMHVV